MIYLSLRRGLTALSLVGLLVLAACDSTASTTVPISPSPTATAGESGGSATPAPTDTAAPVPTDTALPAPTDTAAPAPTDTTAPPPPTDTTAPPPTDTPLVLPTVTPVVAAPTDTAAPPPPTETSAPLPPTPAPAQTDTPASGPRAWQAARGPQKVHTLVTGRDGQLFAGAEDGVFRSTDNGAGWTALTNAFAARQVAVAPSDSRWIYAGFGDGCYSGIPGELHRSTDGGATWTSVSGGPWALDVNPTSPDHLVALKCDGVYKSTDGGQSWTKLPGTGVSNYDGSTLTRGINDRATIYAVYASEGGTAAIQRTTDDGRTWKLLPTPNMYGLHDLAVDPKNAKHIYFVGGSGFYASADGGQTWNKLDKGLEATDSSTGGYLQLSNLALDLVSPPPRNATYTIYVGSYGTSDTQAAGVFRWNGNNAWVPVAPAPNGQSITQLLAVNNAQAPALLAATDTGIYRLPLR